MIDLKPCSFCGNPVHMCRDNRGSFVSCPTCHIEVYFRALEQQYAMGLSQTKEENEIAVAKAWGKRVTKEAPTFIEAEGTEE